MAIQPNRTPHRTAAIPAAHASRAHTDRARGISRRVNAERLVLLGWSRAVLLQVAHPLVAAGVYDHSTFRATSWAAARRLHRTVRAMVALTFGTEWERERTLEGIRAIHRRVHGQLPCGVGGFAAGTRYSAEDPALLLWVHATLLESLPMFYELLVAPLGVRERDIYCEEAADVAVALGASPNDVPRSHAKLMEYMDRMYRSGHIVVGPHARSLAERVLSPPFGPIGAPAASINRLLTLGTLPASVRSQYGFRWTARDERSYTRAVRILHSLRRVVPDAVATWRS
jgi:uncharacterized protein (DUF2236 family)